VFLRALADPLYDFLEVRTDVDFDPTEALVTSYELICHFTNFRYSKFVFFLSTTLPVLAIPPMMPSYSCRPYRFKGIIYG